MEIGLHLPQFGPLATREGITGLAQLAEEHGFESLCVSAQLIVHRKPSLRYRDSGPEPIAIQHHPPPPAPR